ncbi:FAD-dependent oxidoreductase [Microbacterium sp. Marseille-Q6648]|uniref:protoporphyrinogen/coproporphyrinogen oxidase n=1 Tax=Microbacterium sp. Marseille-Q6648 TaxID=2937991 RepID=UPI00203E99E1|nr:FAD-dependent oxidoreductase [Microbacterium sp. Marseille-Q6648]
MTSEVLIAGGGVGGLVLARRLALAGRSVRVFERADRVGGQVAPIRVAGVDLDAAAESFATRGGVVAALLAELGMADDIVTPSPAPAWLHRSDGTAVPLPSTGILGIPGDPAARDVARVIGRRAALRARLDLLLPAEVGQDAATLGALVRARMGAGVVDGLVGPVVRGVHSRDADDVPVESAVPGLRARVLAHGSLAAAVASLRAAAPAGSQVAGIRGGMHRLPHALAADAVAAGARIETGRVVEDITADGLTVDGVRARGHVVRAMPDPTREQAGRVLTLVTLVVDAPALDRAPRGTGILVAPDAPGVTARALTHLTAKWSWIADALPGRHAVRLSYDGEPADAATTAARDLGVLLGAPVVEIEDAVAITWRRAEKDEAPGMPVVGETAGGTGLAAVVGHAEGVARTLLEASSKSPDAPGRERMEP